MFPGVTLMSDLSARLVLPLADSSISSALMATCARSVSALPHTAEPHTEFAALVTLT